MFALGGIFFLLMWNVYAFRCFAPLEWTQGQLILGIVGGGILGTGGIVGMIWSHRHRRAKIEASNAQARIRGEVVQAIPDQGVFGNRILGVIVAVGMLMLGGMTCLCWALTLNAWLDESQGEPRLVMIQGMEQTTHSFLIRTY